MNSFLGGSWNVNDEVGGIMKKIIRTMKVISLLLIILIVVLLSIYIYHRIQLNGEAKLIIPLGELVEVDGHKMSVYVEGEGDKTIVFMSGGGTCSPILDFKSLYSTLSDEYRIVVVEKFGYGFSDVVDKERNIDSILEDTRTALSKANVQGPFVLCPHSMSGIEALYWAQQYPEEVEAIIGLDMAVPVAYEDYKINKFMLKVSQFAARIGITRIMPGVSESDAIKYGTLSDNEKEMYRAIFYKNTATTTMLNEVEYIKENAEIVQTNGVPQLPMLLFVSNGSGTGWNEEEWIKYQNNYIKSVEDGKLIELDCPHYIHDYEYERISKEIKAFILESEVEEEISVPSKEEVLEMREVVLEGMSEEEIERLTENIKVANLRMESAYLYDDIFGKLSDENSLYWNYFDEKGDIQIGWADDEPVMVYNRFDATNFINLIEDMQKSVHNEMLVADLQQLIDLTALAAETHEMEYANEIYKILHDLDYFLLRYGIENVGVYTQDRSVVSKYYGVLQVYGATPMETEQEKEE